MIIAKLMTSRTVLVLPRGSTAWELRKKLEVLIGFITEDTQAKAVGNGKQPPKNPTSERCNVEERREASLMKSLFAPNQAPTSTRSDLSHVSRVCGCVTFVSRITTVTLERPETSCIAASMRAQVVTTFSRLGSAGCGCKSCSRSVESKFMFTCGFVFTVRYWSSPRQMGVKSQSPSFVGSSMV